MKDIRKRNLTLTLILLALSVLLIVLELLPYGAELNFKFPDDAGNVITKRETYSYFSLMPYGYGNFCPLLTAILSCVLLVLGAVALVTKTKQLFAPITILSAAATFFSLIPFGFGLGTWLGGIISLVAFAETALAAYGWTSLKWTDAHRARKSGKS